MIDLLDPLTDEDADVLVDSIAKRVVKLGLTAPVILFLEMHRPLARLAGQAVVVSSPVLAPVFGLDGTDKFARLMYHPRGIEKLSERIEELSNRRVRQEEA